MKFQVNLYPLYVQSSHPLLHTQGNLYLCYYISSIPYYIHKVICTYVIISPASLITYTRLFVPMLLYLQHPLLHTQGNLYLCYHISSIPYYIHKEICTYVIISPASLITCTSCFVPMLLYLQHTKFVLYIVFVIFNHHICIFVAKGL